MVRKKSTGVSMAENKFAQKFSKRGLSLCIAAETIEVLSHTTKDWAHVVDHLHTACQTSIGKLLWSDKLATVCTEKVSAAITADIAACKDIYI